VRIRTVKPEWLSDERLASCSSDARVLSVALMLMADDEGRGRGSVPTIVADVWRFDLAKDDGANAAEVYGRARVALRELSGSGFVVLYEVSGQSYFQLPNFRKHQVINKPTPSKIPPPDATPVGLPEPSGSGEGGKGREGKGNGREGKGEPPAALGPRSSTRTWSALADMMRKAVEAGARAAQMPIPIECSEPDHRAWTECARQALELAEAKGVDARDVMRLAAEEAVLDMPRRAWKVRHLAEDFVALVSAEHIERRAKARGSAAA